MLFPFSRISIYLSIYFEICRFRLQMSGLIKNLNLLSNLSPWINPTFAYMKNFFLNSVLEWDSFLIYMTTDGKSNEHSVSELRVIWTEC